MSTLCYLNITNIEKIYFAIVKMCLVYKHILLLKNPNHHKITNLVTLSLSWTRLSENCKRSEKSHQNWCERHRCNFCIRDLSWGYATGKVIYPKYYKNSNESCTLFFWQIRISGLWWKFLQIILLSKCFLFSWAKILNFLYSVGFES